MKLKQAHVTYFRSIVDSTVVDIEGKVTVLIGKNEQGKSNFLKALQSFNPEYRYSPGDLPTHLRPNLEEREATEIPIVSLWFELETSNKKAFKSFIGEVDKIHQFKITRYYGNNYSYFVIKENGNEEPLQLTKPDVSDDSNRIIDISEELEDKLETHYERLPEFATNREQVNSIVNDLSKSEFNNPEEINDIVQTFSSAMKSLPSQDQAILEDINSAVLQMTENAANIQKIFQTDHNLILKQNIPLFILHSTKADHIPNEVNINNFIQNPVETSRGMHNLCRAAGLTRQKLQELSTTADTSQKEAYEDHYKGIISGGLNEFWTQEEYEIHFRFDREKLSVSISDETYSHRIPPSDRSEGFQWYLSFYSTLLNQEQAKGQSIILLDNPGLELHVNGQNDVKQFLEEKITYNSQVIYVTHSPALIDPFNLTQLRMVELLGKNEGTKISSSITKEGDDFDLLEPVRSAIGTSLIASMILNEFNVLVEGAADKPILEGAFNYLFPEKCEKMLINGSISESKDCILAQFYQRSKLPFVVFLDADDTGRKIESELKKNEIPEDKIILLSSIIEISGRDFELEDTLSLEFYHKAVLETYPSKPVKKPEKSDKKRTNIYEDLYRSQFDIGFSKKRVGETIKRLLNQNEVDKESQKNLKKITKDIINKLEAQVSSSKKIDSKN